MTMVEGLPEDIPLDLYTQWYVTWDDDTTIDEHIPFVAQNAGLIYYECHFGGQGVWVDGKVVKYHFLVYALRYYSNLSRTFIWIDWNTTDPAHASAVQKHFPPPDPLDVRSLKEAAEKYGSLVLNFCLAAERSGAKVDDGECWTLAKMALENVRAQGLNVMTGFGTIHGHLILHRTDRETDLRLTNVQPGDIIQYLAAQFDHYERGKLVKRSVMGAPHHTA
jgi:hypothetical protein